MYTERERERSIYLSIYLYISIYLSIYILFFHNTDWEPSGLHLAAEALRSRRGAVGRVA